MPPQKTPSSIAPRAGSDSSADQSLDLRMLFFTLLEKSWIVAIAFVTCLLLSAGYIQRAPRIYSATATLQVESEEQRVLTKIEQIQKDDPRSLEALKTIEQTLENRALLTRVLETNNLANNPEFIAGFKEKPTKEQLVDALSKNIDVKLRRGTRLIDVTVNHTSPQLTSQLANSLVREFSVLNYEQRSSTAKGANAFLLEEQKRLKEKLQESENALQAYREKTQMSSMESRQNAVTAKLQELSQKVTEAKSARIRIATDYAQVKEMGNSVQNLLVLPMVANDPVVASLRATISKLEIDFSTIKERYKEKHPKYLQSANQLLELRKELTNAVLMVPQMVKAQVTGAQAAEEALDQALKEQEAEVLELNKHAIEYNVLAREVESDRALFDSVLNRMKETDLTKEMQVEKVRITSPAVVPEKPVSPNKLKILVAAALAGLMGGVLLALGLSAMDTSLKTVDQVEEALNLPVLSAVPQVKQSKDNKGQLVVSEDSKSQGAEAFRSLRTSLTMSGKEEGQRTILFTSALPQEGKTFCSVNYALCLAQQGLKTLLIDGDLRRPAVEQVLLGERKKDPGVTDYLVGQKKFKDLLYTLKQEHFAYMPAGSTAPNPAELLAQGGMKGLIEEALLHFDRVVIDSAPIHAVSDTMLMVEDVHRVCMVVRAGRTPKRGVVRAVQMLQQAKAPLVGVVLNRLARRRVGGGYYYNPYYDYQYHDTYAEKGVYGSK